MRGDGTEAYKGKPGVERETCDSEQQKSFREEAATSGMSAVEREGQGWVS